MKSILTCDNTSNNSRLYENNTLEIRGDYYRRRATTDDPWPAWKKIEGTLCPRGAPGIPGVRGIPDTEEAEDIPDTKAMDFAAPAGVQGNYEIYPYI